jgi:hypothetical protein
MLTLPNNIYKRWHKEPRCRKGSESVLKYYTTVCLACQGQGTRPGWRLSTLNRRNAGNSENSVGEHKGPLSILTPLPLVCIKRMWRGGGGSMYLYRVAQFANREKWPKTVLSYTKYGQFGAIFAIFLSNKPSARWPGHRPPSTKKVQNRPKNGKKCDGGW